VHSFPPSHIQIRFLGTSVVPLNKLKGAAAGQSYISIGNVPLSLDFITQDVPTSSCIKFINEMLARAKRVSDGVQSKVLMCSLEKFYHLRTRSMEGAISKWKIRKIMHRKIISSCIKRDGATIERKEWEKVYSPRYRCVHLEIPTTSKRAAWKLLSARKKCARSYTVTCLISSCIEGDGAIIECKEWEKVYSLTWWCVHMDVAWFSKRAARKMPWPSKTCAYEFSVRCFDYE